MTESYMKTPPPGNTMPPDQAQDIRDFYARKDREREEARQRWLDAVNDPSVTAEEKRRLFRKYVDVGNTGDV